MKYQNEAVKYTVPASCDAYAAYLLLNQIFNPPTICDHVGSTYHVMQIFNIVDTFSIFTEWITSKSVLHNVNPIQRRTEQRFE